MVVNIEFYKRLEDDWWKSIPNEIKKELVNEGLNPNDMRFFGEICFVECGAKPMAILSGIPSKYINSYFKKVLEQSGSIVHGSVPVATNTPTLHAGLLPKLKTPNFDLSGSIYVCNTAHALFPKIATEVLASKVGEVSESLIAEVLGYPFSLPERELNQHDDIVEIGYVENKTETLLASYGALLEVFECSKIAIKEHYSRYTTLTKGTLDFRIVCTQT